MKRIIIDVPDEEAQKIDELMKLCNLSTRTAYFKSANEIFAWLIEQKRLGKKIFAQKPGENTIAELESASLRNASKYPIIKIE